MTIMLSDSSDAQGDYKFDIKYPLDFQDPSMDISNSSTPVASVATGISASSSAGSYQQNSDVQGDNTFNMVISIKYSGWLRRLCS
jgi:hypothetical protein